MPIDFPANPTLGQRFRDYIYDGSRQTWRRLEHYHKPRASGGVRNDGDTANTTVTTKGYTYHVFQGSGTLTVYRPGHFEVLAIGGGGGGGCHAATSQAGGGGGAGGLLHVGEMYLEEGDYSIVVGSGGVGAPTSGARVPGVGGHTSLAFAGAASFGMSGVIAVGGGPGGSRDGPELGVTDTVGGSGGGGYSNNSRAGLGGIATQGFSGGNGRGGEAAGGGGGAGQAGLPALADPGNAGGNGGGGTTEFIGWATVTNTGSFGLYAGGGGGGGDAFGGPPGAGGGGEGNTGTATTGRDGLANTGGGGGGVENTVGGAGGSGIVIVRYLSDIPENFDLQYGFLGEYERNADTNNFSFSNVYIGGSGLIVVAFSGFPTATAATLAQTNTVAVTIDGQAATLASQTAIAGRVSTSLWYANISSPSSNSVTVLANTGSAFLRSVIGVWRVENYSSLTPANVGNTTALTTTAASVTTSSLTAPAVIIASYNANTQTTATFTGVSENYDTITREGGGGFAGGSARVTANGAVTITANANVSASKALAYAVWT